MSPTRVFEIVVPVPRDYVELDTGRSYTGSDKYFDEKVDPCCSLTCHLKSHCTGIANQTRDLKRGRTRVRVFSVRVTFEHVFKNFPNAPCYSLPGALIRELGGEHRMTLGPNRGDTSILPE